MIHRQALAPKTLPDLLENVLQDIKRAVSFMKNSALNTRRFQQAYKEWIPWARLYPSTQRPAKCVSAIAHSTGAGDYVCQML